MVHLIQQAMYGTSSALLGETKARKKHIFEVKCLSENNFKAPTADVLYS